MRGLVAFLPSVRVTAREFVRVLTREGIGVELLGVGTAEAVDATGRLCLRGDALIARVALRDLRRVAVRAGLCGVGAVLLDQARSSRANVVS